jgi:hypothetical protein
VLAKPNKSGARSLDSVAITDNVVFLGIIAAEMGRKGAKAHLSKAGRKGRRRESVPRTAATRERLAENSAVSEQTITALAGQVSNSRLARYLDNRQADNQAAMDELEAVGAITQAADFDAGSPQNPSTIRRQHDQRSFCNYRQVFQLIRELTGTGERFRTVDLVLGKFLALRLESPYRYWLYCLMLWCP